MAKSTKAGGANKDGSYKGFNIDDPELPEDIAEKALTSGGYPYDKKLKKADYADELDPLQFELLNLHAHVQKEG